MVRGEARISFIRHWERKVKMKQTIDAFLKKQYMDTQSFEIYNYSDMEIPAITPHRHTFYEIYYVLSEQLNYVIGKNVYQLQKGDFMLIPPGQLHYPSETNLKLGNKYSRIVLWCNTAYFDRFCAIEPALRVIWDTVQENCVYHFSPSQGETLHLYDHLLYLLSENRHKDYASSAMCFAILLEIFVLIGRIVNEKDYIKTHTVTDSLFVNIVYYIHTHLTANISLDELASHFWISKGYISRFFKEYVGLSVHQYILSLRLDGCRLAINKGKSVTQAAEMFGFNDYSSFYRAFKKVFASSPKEYQRSLGPAAETPIREQSNI